MYFNKTDKLVTHYGCMDGSGCAALFVAAGGALDNVHYSSPSHESVDKLAQELFDTHKGRIFFADISVSEDMARLLNERVDIALFDHHKSAIPLAKYSWCEIDVENKRCGSKIFYDFIMSQSPYSRISDFEEIVKVIDDRDRWACKDPRSQKFADLFSSLKQNLFVNRLLHDSQAEITSTEDWMLWVEREKKNDYMKHVETRCLVREMEDGSGNTHNVCFVLCDPPYATDVGHFLYDKYNYDAVVMVSPTSVSFRAPKHSKLDMAQIVKQYGGGGHQGAGGCNTSNITGRHLLNEVANALTLP